MYCGQHVIGQVFQHLVWYLVRSRGFSAVKPPDNAPELAIIFQQRKDVYCAIAWIPNPCLDGIAIQVRVGPWQAAIRYALKVPVLDVVAVAKL